MQNRDIILASASPRRQELMKRAGFDFEVRISDKEERYCSTTPEEIVKELAMLKARDVAEGTKKANLVILGADTVVAVDEKILGKPKDREDALAMIRSIQGRSHQVYTGIAILQYDEQGKEEMISHAVCTEVIVCPMSEDEICEYVDGEDIMDKAGAYAIQGVFGAKYIERFVGDYYNVVGLPISYIYQRLKK